MATSPARQRRRGRPPKGTRGDTRQELLDAALRLFARQGYAATTVRQISDEVGIRDSAIYAHFGAKREMLDALIDESGAQLIERLAPDFSRLPDEPPEEVLADLFEGLVDEWDKPRPRQLISLLTREGFAGSPDVLGAVTSRLAPHFRRWSADGHLRKDVSLNFLLWELTTPLAAIRILYLNADASAGRRKEGRRLAREHVDYFLATATTSPGSARRASARRRIAS